MKLNSNAALEGALRQLIRMNSDPDFIKNMQAERARRNEYARKNYEQKLNYWKNKSGYVVHETGNGFKAYAKGSVIGKQIVAMKMQEKRESERTAFISETPLDAALDDICCGENPVSKIEVRAALSKYTGFTPEKFNTLIEMVEEEGIDIN
jgi:hypothetical protein